MRVRRFAPALLLVLSAAFVSFLASSAGAQIQQPDITGSGSCYQTPGNEPSLVSFTVGFDAFLRERSAQVRSAAAHWLTARSGPAVAHARPASISRVAR